MSCSNYVVLLSQILTAMRDSVLVDNQELVSIPVSVLYVQLPDVLSVAHQRWQSNSQWTKIIAGAKCNLTKSLSEIHTKQLA